MPGKIAGWIITMLLAGLLLLIFNRNSLSNQVKKREAELIAEQATNVALGNIIDAYHANDTTIRAATTRQLDNERRLRNASDEKFKRFKAAAASDDCSIKPMPDANTHILRE
ncbi:MAG: DUF2570 domain-containing protein [Yersinia sp. (in: enterobacteria)]